MEKTKKIPEGQYYSKKKTNCTDIPKNCKPPKYFDKQVEDCLMKPKCPKGYYFDENKGKCLKKKNCKKKVIV